MLYTYLISAWGPPPSEPGRPGSPSKGPACAMAIPLKEAIAKACQRVREDAVVEARAQLLPSTDRDLLLAVWMHHQPTRMIARMCRRSPRAVRRRVRTLIDRLHSERFVGAARAMRFLNPQQAELARLHLCHGLSVRSAGRAMGVGYHRARRLATEVEGVIRGLKAVANEQIAPRRRPGEGKHG